MDYEDRIQALGLELPPAPKPVGSYRPLLETQRFAFLSGQISKTADGKILAGKVGKDLTLEQGQAAARAAALNVASVIRNLLGFEKFGRFLRVVGYVQTAPDFYEIPQVLNAASDLLVEVFGENGSHARTAVGMASLPLNAAVEIEVTLELKGK